MLQFSANLYRIVQSVASNEETRYYLGGVFVEPAPRGHSGVVMTATDGHRLLHVYDAYGKADESAIVKLSDFALKACKGKNVVRIDTGSQVARVYEVPQHMTWDCMIEDTTSLTMLASCGVDPAVRIEKRYDADYGVECDVTVRGYSSDSCKIDGTFPAYRNVIPSYVSSPSEWGGAFNGSYVAAFGKIAGELANHFNDSRSKAIGTLRLISPDPGSPALILFPSNTQAFGVLMPMRADTSSVRLPDWYTPLPEVRIPVPQLEYQKAA